jgi:hypothetical protein
MELVIFAIIRILAVNYVTQISAINVNKILLYSMEVVFVTIISSYKKIAVFVLSILTYSEIIIVRNVQNFILAVQHVQIMVVILAK